jgi:hypothetical protein
MIFFFTIPALLIIVLIILGASVLGIAYMWIQAHMVLICVIIAIINLLYLIFSVREDKSESINGEFNIIFSVIKNIFYCAMFDFGLAMLYGFLYIIAGILGWT